MRFYIKTLPILLALLLPAGAQAALLNVEPDFSALNIDDPLTVDLTISDLGNEAAPSVGIFDLDLSYDPTILTFTGASYGDQLDLLGFGSLQLTNSNVAGIVNLFELSFDNPTDLDLSQLPSFSLAKLTFNALTVGSSDLLLSINALGDSFGDPLASDISNASIRVNSSVVTVPEPSLLALFALGLAGLFNFRLRAS